MCRVHLWPPLPRFTRFSRARVLDEAPPMTGPLTVGDGTLDAAAAFGGGAAPEGVARRAVPRCRGGLRQGRTGPHRQGSRPTRVRGHRSGVPEVRGVPERPPGPSVAASGGHPTAGRRGWQRGAPHRLEAAGLRDGPQDADQPGLRRRVRVRPDGEPCHRRERTQARGPRPAPGAGRVGRVDPRPARGLRCLGGVREEPAADRRQRQLPVPRLFRGTPTASASGHASCSSTVPASGPFTASRRGSPAMACRSRRGRWPTA